MENPAFIAAPVQAAPAPFSLGRVLGRTFSIWGENLLAFSILVLVLQAPSLALTLLAGPPPEPGTLPDASHMVLNLLNTFLGLFLALVSTGALTRGALRSMAGHRAGAGELLAAGFRTLGRVFAASLNAGLRVLLWSLLLVVPGVMAACRYFVAVPAAVTEPGSSTDAVERSAALTEGRRGSIFLVLLILWVIALIVGGAIGAGVGLAGTVPFPVIAVVSWLANSIVSGVWSTATGVAYHDLRIEKEGASTEQLAAVFE